VTDRRVRRALVGLVVLAAALRLWRIGHQSFWLDETFTASLVDEDLGGLVSGVRETESTPHLYYLLAWLWARAAGDGEAALRTLSALFGIAAVPLAYAAARELLRPRIALIAAALVAVNPWLVWYSQEARAYSLLVLLSTLSLLYFVRAWRAPAARARGEPPGAAARGGGPAPGRTLALWALASALAVLTHYFAAFLVAPEGLALLWRHRTRAALAASGAVAAVGLALAPLALDQRASGHTKFISEISLGRRVTDLPKKFVTGELGTPTPGLGPAAGALVAAGAALLVWRAARSERRAGLAMAALAAVTLAVPLTLAAAGLDYLFPRNALAAFVPAAIALSAGFGTARAGRLGPAAAAALCATAIAVTIQVSLNPSLQRDDWRGLARALGPPAGDRALVLNPQVQVHALEHYLPGPGLVDYPPPGATVREVDAVLVTRGSPPRAPQAPSAAFRLVERRGSESWRLARFEAPAPAPVGPPFAEQSRLDYEAPAIRLQRRR
jgi:hypothetical protein